MNEKRVSDQLIETIRDRTDLTALVSEYLSLKKSGQNYTGLCPFHGEKTPSFVVSPGKQIFHCFGCGAGGNVFQFLMKMEGLSFPQALQRLAERGGIPLPNDGNRFQDDSLRRETDQIYRLNEQVAAYWQKNLLEKPEGARAVSYLKERGITLETIQAFSVGFALPKRDDLLKSFSKKFPPSLLEKAGLISRKDGTPSSGDRPELFDRFRNRIIFPIRTLQGKVVGFGGRVMDQSLPKYLNTPETPIYTKGAHLFGLDQAKKAGPHTLIIVEGYFDAVAAHQAGISNVVATLGTALTQDHLQLIRRMTEKAILIFDPDEAGTRAALRAAPLFIEKEISAEVVSLPAGEDPDLFIRKNGKEAFLKRVAGGKTLIDFAISKIVGNPPPKSIDDKVKALKEIFPFIEKLKHKVEQSHYLKRLSDEIGIGEGDLRAEFAVQTAKKGGAYPSVKAQTRAIPVGGVAPPKDEEILTTLLLQGQAPLPEIRRRLDLTDFTDPRIKSILSHVWDDGPNGGPLRPDLNAMEKEAVELWSRLSVRDIAGDIENPQRNINDCIASLRAKRLQREKDEIQKKLRLAEKGGDLSLVKSLQQKDFDLKKELSHLTLSHKM